MKFETSISNCALEGTPEEVEEWIDQAITDGWEVAKRENRYDQYAAADAFAVTLYRFIDVPEGCLHPESTLPPEVQYVLKDMLIVPTGKGVIHLRASSFRYNENFYPKHKSPKDWGQISAYIPYQGEDGHTYCAFVKLPLQYDWQEIVGFLPHTNAWIKDICNQAMAKAEKDKEQCDHWQRIAFLAREKADPRRPPEAFLPYVIACLHFWRHHASIEAINQKSYYSDSFSQLTNREFNAESDTVTEREIADMPDPAPLTDEELAMLNAPPLYECLECGAVFDQAQFVESGKMGCDRCNGVANTLWKQHLQ